MTKVHRKSAKGQAVEAVALLLALGVLIGLVALAFDGGSALLQRRTQENGAQAGALAGVDLMAHNVLTNCQPDPTHCHPAYLLTNSQVYAQVSTLATANRGGTTGAQPSDYTISIDYHYTADSPNYPNSFHAAPNDSNPVPEYADGLRVTAAINNPTTFAKALPIPITNLSVSGQAAALIYPTCAPEGGLGAPLPFTRLRARLEWEIKQNGQNYNAPYELWNSHSDASPQWKNTISLNVNSFVPHNGISQQLITGFDTRNGVENPIPPNQWPNSGLLNYNKIAGAGNLTPCSSGPNCADMRGSGSTQSNATAQDMQNWTFWGWRGVISTTHLYTDPNTNTYFPSDAAHQGGTCCGAQNNRPGDWAEVRGYKGDQGSNIKSAMLDEISVMPAQYGGGTIGPLSGPPFNWGKAIIRTVFVWGEPDSGLPSPKSTQTWGSYPPPCSQLPCPPDVPAWLDVTMSGSNGNYNFSGGSVDRIRFTKAYTFIFYDVPLSGGNSSQIFGFLIDPLVGGPGGTCEAGWQTGSGVYYRQVDPNP